MKVVFDKSFNKSLDKIKDSKILNRTADIIVQLENANLLFDVRNIKKLEGYSNYYRIKLGNYRIGFELLENNIIKLIVLCHRKDVYRVFP